MEELEAIKKAREVLNEAIMALDDEAELGEIFFQFITICMAYDYSVPKIMDTMKKGGIAVDDAVEASIKEIYDVIIKAGEGNPELDSDNAQASNKKVSSNLAKSQPATINTNNTDSAATSVVKNDISADKTSSDSSGPSDAKPTATDAPKNVNSTPNT